MFTPAAEARRFAARRADADVLLEAGDVVLAPADRSSARRSRECAGQHGRFVTAQLRECAGGNAKDPCDERRSPTGVGDESEDKAGKGGEEKPVPGGGR